MLEQFVELIQTLQITSVFRLFEWYEAVKECHWVGSSLHSEILEMFLNCLKENLKGKKRKFLLYITAHKLGKTKSELFKLSFP